MRTTTPSTILRRTAAALATSLLLGACWSDIKDEGHNQAGGDVQTPTAYDSSSAPSTIPHVAPTTPSQPGAPSPNPGTDSTRRDSTRPPGGG